jgi:hypothetical protein
MAQLSTGRTGFYIPPNKDSGDLGLPKFLLDNGFPSLLRRHRNSSFGNPIILAGNAANMSLHKNFRSV